MLTPPGAIVPGENALLNIGTKETMRSLRADPLFPNDDVVDHFADFHVALSLARIECHYFVNHCFLGSDKQLLKGIDTIRHIPAVIVQGRYDVVCTLRSAWELHRAWPEASLTIVPDAGHSAFEPGNTAALVEATDRFRGG